MTIRGGWPRLASSLEPRPPLRGVSRRTFLPGAKILTAFFYLALSWLPVAGADYYHVWFQAHYRIVEPCPTPETPDMECVRYAAGVATSTDVIACGERCSTGVTLPSPGSGDVLWFQLVAVRGGCESVTAFPPQNL